MPINISLNFIMESESCWSNLITEEPELRTLSGRQNEDLCQSAILSSTPKEEDPVESMRIRTPLSDELTNREAHVVTRSLPKNRDIQTASGVELNPSWLREVTSVPQVGIADYHSYSLPSGVPVIEHDGCKQQRALLQVHQMANYTSGSPRFPPGERSLLHVTSLGSIPPQKQSVYPYS